MKNLVRENLIKNILLVVVLALLYPLIQDFLISSKLAIDNSSAGSIIVVTSIIAVTACFGNFAFTYEKINIKDSFQRYLAHFTTGLFMLVMAISLIFTAILTKMIMGYFILIDITLIILYLACIGYDFWDVYRESR